MLPQKEERYQLDSNHKASPLAKISSLIFFNNNDGNWLGN